MSTCAICHAPNASNEAHHALSPWKTEILCNPCLARVTAPKPKTDYRRPCGICGRVLHIQSMGTVHDWHGRPIHRECLRAQQPRTRQAPRFHCLPWAALLPSQRMWEMIYSESHLDDLEADRNAIDRG